MKIELAIALFGGTASAAPKRVEFRPTPSGDRFPLFAVSTR